MKIFLDFDNTLIHSRKFFEEYYKPLLKSFTVEVNEDSYSAFSSGPDASKKAFTPKRHLEVLGVSEAVKEKIWSIVKTTFKTHTGFLFQDTEETLENLKSSELYLLTYGEKKYQSMKIEASGIKRFFQECLITEGKKSDIIRGCLGTEERGIFVDDREEYFPVLQNEFKERLTMVHFLHFEIGKVCEGCQADYHATSGNELKAIIKNICAE